MVYNAIIQINGELNMLKANTIYHCDCRELMDEICGGVLLPNGEIINKVNCIITDPPYGIGEDGAKNHSRGLNPNSNDSHAKAQATQFTPKQWDKQRITKDFFDKMFACSDNQIIFGGNYYTDFLYPTSCWIVWDKNNCGNDFADCELAWTSYKSAVRKVKWTWNGMLQEDMKNKEKRIHPTQKPIGMLEWIVRNYTKEGDIILDPFSGSGSVAIACRKNRRNYIACELDEEYYNASKERMDKIFAQQSLFWE